MHSTINEKILKTLLQWQTSKLASNKVLNQNRENLSIEKIMKVTVFAKTLFSFMN